MLNAGVNIIYLMKEKWEGVQDKIIAMVNLLSSLDDNDIQQVGYTRRNTDVVLAGVQKQI